MLDRARCQLHESSGVLESFALLVELDDFVRLRIRVSICSSW